ncbi:MAG: RNase adapter RapZ [Mariprofundales bacterium]|nr:RNase adapter RapZ [Mariprofundales bacterium]
MIIVSGLSGSGKSTALHTLEDLGCFCTDNLPPELLSDWAAQALRNHQYAAVCVDARSAESPQLLAQDLQRRMEQNHRWKLLFIDSTDRALQRRFSTVRRRHPFAPNTNIPEAITRERKALAPLREQADRVLDSSELNPYELADLVEQFWMAHEQTEHKSQQLFTSLVSFSYQRGLPESADMVIDIRFLPNPHYETDMAQLTGQDAEVATFLHGFSQTNTALEQIQQWLTTVRPQMVTERKHHFTLAIGCSGGRHRSVYMVEQLAQWMRQQSEWLPLNVRHRELGLQRTMTTTNNEG